MRLRIEIDCCDKFISYNHQHLLAGVIYKWLGGKGHGSLSLYSFGRLNNGQRILDKLYFDRGTSFFFSSFDVELIKKIITGIKKDSNIFFGLKVSKYYIEDDPNFLTDNFFTSSPIFIKRRNTTTNKIDHIRYDDDKSSQYLKETILNKMEVAEFTDTTFDVKFNKTYKNAKTQLVQYKNINNKTNLCPVIITGSTEVKKFIWNVGLGNSTGIGFGGIETW